MGAQDGFYTLDANGAIDFCNPAMAELLGYDRDELLGVHASEVMAQGQLEYGQRVIQELIDDADRHEMEAVLERVTDGDNDTEAVELTVETADGRRFPAEVHTVFSLPRTGHTTATLASFGMSQSAIGARNGSKSSPVRSPTTCGARSRSARRVSTSTGQRARHTAVHCRKRTGRDGVGHRRPARTGRTR
jgi:PAS domain-containing protein